MKRTVNFRFSDRTLAVLQQLAQERGQTRTQVLEDLILSQFKPSSAKQLAELSEQAAKLKRSGGRLAEEQVPGLQPARAGHTLTGRGSVKRTQSIPKPDWKK